MKQLNLKNTTIMAIILLAGLFTSFSPASDKEEVISHNVEALSRGEGGANNPCINAEGKCHIYGHTYIGLTNKN